MKKILYVGLDVHKESIAVAVAGEGEEVRSYATIPNNSAALDSLVRKLKSSGHLLKFVYEAGPGGYGIFRYLSKVDIFCMVAAPSLIPRKAGDKIKTDKRDAKMLARLFRAGELTGIVVPDEDDEAVRDLFRARCTAKKMEKQARQNLLSFFLRIGIVYPGKGNWTKTHVTWLDALSLPHPAHQLALQEYIDSIKQCKERVARIDGMLQDVVRTWKRENMVKRMQLLRGVAFLTAVGIVAELGDIHRFASAKQLMAYTGLVPSENSSGSSIRRGGITKTGNTHVRRLLTEAAWSYRLKARKSSCLLKRQIDASVGELAISWKAQVRLCGRYQRLLQKGKPKNKVVSSIARELAGFIWALGNFES